MKQRERRNSYVWINRGKDQQSSSDDSVNVLVALLNATDQKVVLEALNSLGKVGTDHAVANLQLMFREADPSNKELKDAIQTTLNKIRAREKE